MAIDANLKDLRISVILLLSFAGFFRSKELENTRTSHMTICSFLYQVVKHVYKGGNKAIIARTSNVTSPVNMVLRYMTAAKMDTNSSGLLTRQLTFRKNSNSYVLGNMGISYFRCREIFLDALAALGYDSKLFRLHSLRSAGQPLL